MPSVLHELDHLGNLSSAETREVHDWTIIVLPIRQRKLRIHDCRGDSCILTLGQFRVWRLYIGTLCYVVVALSPLSTSFKFVPGFTPNHCHPHLPQFSRLSRRSLAMVYPNPAPYPSLPHVGAPASGNEAQQHFGAQRDSGDAYPYHPRPSASNGTAPGAFPGVQDGFQRSVETETVKSGQAEQTQAQTDAQKGNRLRKACDSCSIRKVKVSACDATTSPPNAPTKADIREVR